MPKTPAERTAILRDFLLDAWMGKAGLTRADWDSFEHGIPVEWARALEDMTGGLLKPEDWPRVIHPPKGLHRVDTDDTLSGVDVNTSDAPASVKRGAGRATRKSKAQKKLYEAKKTITSVSLELREGRPRVSAWFADGDVQRPVPGRHRAYFKKLGITEADGIRFAD